MPQGPFTRIVIRRPNGSVDVIGRHGVHEPNRLARLFREAAAGDVLAVRHETQIAGARQTLALHHLRA